MLHGGLVVAISLAYAGLLFAIAFYGDRRPRSGRQPLTYGLALAVFCTSWGFFGVIGQAASLGWASDPPLGSRLIMVPTYIGPFLALLLGWRFFDKLVRIGKRQKITSIADFISARYGKSQGLAALVAVIAVVGVIPYIALQLKSIAATYQIITAGAVPPGAAPPWADTALYVALLMAVFAILFGTRHLDATERHQGMMLAIAFESGAKLVAWLAVGGFITYGMYGGFDDLAQRLALAPELARLGPPDAGSVYLVQALLSAVVMFCLPRQFHVAVVENSDRRDVRTARWLFPLYLIAISVFVWPVAVAGLLYFPSGAVDADTYMLTLPLAGGRPALALLAFIGGFSAGTGMVIVATVAVSIMVCNDVVMPLLLRARRLALNQRSDLGWLLLLIRRCSITLTLLLAYGYYRLTADYVALASFGVLSFAAAAQVAPALIGGVYWRRASRRGAWAGLSVGFALWAYTLLLPTLARAGLVPQALLAQGPFGVEALRPTALLGFAGPDPLTHGVLWSLAANIGCYVLFSLGGQRRLVEREQAAAFVDLPAEGVAGGEPLRGHSVRVEDLEVLARRFLGVRAARGLFAAYAAEAGRVLHGGERAETALVERVERRMAGVIGASSARVVLGSALRGRDVQLEEVATIVGEASQVVQFNRGLLQATFESVSQGICVTDEQLRIVAWNRRFIEIFPYLDPLMRVGLRVEELLELQAGHGEYEQDAAARPADEQIAERLRLLRLERAWSGLRTRPDGTVLEIHGQPTASGGRAITYTDVTDHKRAEQALREAKAELERRVAQRTAALTASNQALEQARQEAEQANRSKTRFLAAASHDLLQPLNAAALFCSALAPRVQDGESRQLVAHLSAALHSGEELLGELLDISKLDAGALKPHLTSFALDELLLELAAEFGVLARDKGLELRVVACRQRVTSDRQLLRRLLLNLLSNAVRYTLRGRVLLGCRRAGGQLRIEVWDSGPGVAVEQQQRIFEEFHRLDHHDGQGDKCLGLGLAIAERVARSLQHPLGLRSWPGRGSVFHVGVPRAPAAVNPLSVPAPPPGGIPAGLRVLCVDNEPSILEGMRALLEGWGCAVATATEPAAAERVAAGVEVVIADYHLDGGADGLALIEGLRAGRSEPAGVLLTADRSDGVAGAAQALGVTCLYKPLKPARLRALLAAVRRPVPA